MPFKSGKDNPNYGKPAWNRGKSIKFNNALEEWKEAGGITWNKGKAWSKETKNKISKTLTGRRLSKKHKDNISKGVPKGPDHHAYVDGTGGTGYKRFSKELKEIIKQRDNNCCQNCELSRKEHKEKYNLDIEVHHIDYDKTNNKEDNLITLCKRCNIRANYNKEYWNEYFKSKAIANIKNIGRQQGAWFGHSR